MSFWRNALPIVGGIAGGAIGSVIPGAGTALGAGLGMAAGGMIGGAVDPVTGEVTPTQVPNVANVAGQSPEQASFLEALRNRYESAGTMPSVAQEQLRQSTNESNNVMAGALGSIRGNQNPGLAARNIIDQTNFANQKASGQASLLRAQETVDNEKMKQLQESTLLDAYEKNRQALLDQERIKAGLSGSAMTADANARAAAIKAQSDYMGNIGTAATQFGIASMKQPQQESWV